MGPLHADPVECARTIVRNAWLRDLSGSDVSDAAFGRRVPPPPRSGAWAAGVFFVCVVSAIALAGWFFLLL